MKTTALGLCLAVFCAGKVVAQETTADYPPPATRDNMVRLFNGHDFSGFTFCLKDNADPRGSWSVTNGVIHCTGSPAGYLRTTQCYSNYFLTVEWRLLKTAPADANAGILVQVQTPDQLWPQCVKIQGIHDRQGDLFLLEGAESKEHKGLGQSNPVAFRGPSRENPVGQWNIAEIICIHHEVEAYVNGYFMNETTECTLDSGYIGIQSSGASLEIRSLYFSPLKY
jgi:hypothetical protein